MKSTFVKIFVYVPHTKKVTFYFPVIVLGGGGKRKDHRFSSGRFEPVKKGVGERGLKNSAVVLV